MKSKLIVAILIILFVLVPVISGCGSTDTDNPAQNEVLGR